MTHATRTTCELAAGWEAGALYPYGTPPRSAPWPAIQLVLLPALQQPHRLTSRRCCPWPHPRCSNPILSYVRAGDCRQLNSALDSNCKCERRNIQPEWPSELPGMPMWGTARLPVLPVLPA
jgi:hypothetical protein